MKKKNKKMIFEKGRKIRLTLDKAWQLCIQQWQDVISELKKRPDKSVAALKYEWLEKHEFGEINADCFFCHYAKRFARCESSLVNCARCPARKVDKTFDCSNSNYCYADEPFAFYKKLLELNRTRKQEQKICKTCGGEITE